MKNKNKCTGLFIASIALGILGSVQAGFAADEGYAPRGVHMGGFYLYPALEVGIGYDDNVFRLPDENVDATGAKVPTSVGDTAITGKAQVTANSDWNRHALNGLASINLGKYSDYDSEDFGEYELSGDGTLDIKRGSSVTARAGTRYLRESRSSVDSREVSTGTGTDSTNKLVYGAEPTRFTDDFVGVGYRYKPARFEFSLDVDYSTLDYEDNTNIFGGDIDNSDRDRSLTEARMRVGYDVMPKRNVYIQGQVNGVDYDQPLDQNGIERSSTGYKITGGMNFDLSNLLLGDVYIGYLEQNYDSPTQSDITSNVYGAGLKWFPSRLTGVDFHLDQNVEESTEATASGYLSTTARVNVTHELKRNIILRANADYTLNEFEQNVEGQKEQEAITGFGLEGRYLISRLLHTGLEYRYENRVSDIAVQEYTYNRALLTLGVHW